MVIGMVIGFVIWSIVAGIFLSIGISGWKSKDPVGFFTFRKPPTVKDVKKYNQAVSLLWMIAAAVLEIIGIPFLFLKQNSPLFLPIIFAIIILILAMMIGYTKIEAKYRI